MKLPNVNHDITTTPISYIHHLSKMFRASFTRSFLLFKNYTRRIFSLPPEADFTHKSLTIPFPKYGGEFMVTALPGAGTGPELFSCLQQVLQFMGAPIYFEVISGSTYEDILKRAMISLRRNGVAIKGNIARPTDDIGMALMNATVRRKLDLFVNVMWCKSFPGVCKKERLDLIIFRQNLGGEYAMLEHESAKGVTTSYKIMWREKVEKLARFSYRYAMKYKRRRVTIMHRADILVRADGLFLDTIRKVAEEFPKIQTEDLRIGHCCGKLMNNPEYFDVIITTNLFGVALANVVCGLTGEAGIVSAKNFSDKCAVFEPGLKMAFKEITKADEVNPISMLNAGVDMLCYLELNDYGQALKRAIKQTLYEDKVLTRDLGGNKTTSDVIRNIIARLCDFRPLQR